MNVNPETYEELIRWKKCYDIAKVYHVIVEELEKIYDFLEKNSDGKIVGDKYKLTMIANKNIVDEIVTDVSISAKYDGVIVTNNSFSLKLAYTSSGGSYSSGGGSSNNNNNNNNR